MLLAKDVDGFTHQSLGLLAASAANATSARGAATAADATAAAPTAAPTAAAAAVASDAGASAVDGVGGAAGMGPCAAPGAAGDGPEEELFGACTPLGCLALLKHAGVALRGKDAVVVGASQVSACEARSVSISIQGYTRHNLASCTVPLESLVCFSPARICPFLFTSRCAVASFRGFCVVCARLYNHQVVRAAAAPARRLHRDDLPRGHGRREGDAK